MSLLCRHIANAISSDLPEFSLGDGIFIGPPRPYETAADQREGSPPLHIFINESGGLQDVRSIGTSDAKVSKSIKVVLRSSKTLEANTGSRGAFAEGMRLALKLEHVARNFSNEWVEDLKIVTPATYLGKHEDDMHYWSLNLRTAACSNYYPIYSGGSFFFKIYTDIESNGIKDSAIYSGDYDVTGPETYKYILIPEDYLQGFSLTVSMTLDSVDAGFDPDISNTEIDGINYRAYWYSSGSLDGDVNINVLDI